MEKHIMVLGGGFAGVEAAIRMRKYGYKFTLVSNRDYLFIYPTSIWVPVGKKSFEDVSMPLGQLAKKHGFEIVVNHFTSIDTESNKVLFEDHELSFDYLILAIGMGKMKPKGIEHTHSICGQPEESLKIKEELEKLVEKGSGKIAIGFGGNPKDKSAVRGGPAFEMLFNFSHFLKKRGVRDKFEITFFAPMAEPGKRMGTKAISRMPAFFKQYNIKSQTGTKIKAFESDGVLFVDGSKLESDLTLFIPGGDGHPALKNSKLPLNETGFVRIDDHCKVEGFDHIYAAGDVAELGGPDWAAKQGHTAEVMAQVAAYNIHQTILGESKRKGYLHHLNIICVMDSGDGAAFVYRKNDKSMMIPMPVFGHWMKQGWGFYFKHSKMGRIPRIPGM
jgi:sulfide:quinone oxidoreductase